MINALNSGANVYMADFEDSNCPTWANLIEVRAGPRIDHVPTFELCLIWQAPAPGAQPFDGLAAMAQHC